MAISVGDAVLKLGVDTKSLDAGMKGLGAKIKKHQKAIGIGMAAAGGAILAAGILSVKTFAEMGDEVQKLALKTGFSTEALSELRFAAEQSGASLGSLEKGVKKMAVSISDARDGLMTYTREFDKIGVSMEDLEELNPEQQFFKIAEAIAAIEDPTQRAASAQKLLGRAGTELLPLFAQGKEGMAALREEAHKLGIVFDQEAANAAAEMTDAMHRTDQAVSGLKMKIAQQLIPILIPLVDKITAIISSVTAWAKEHPNLTKALVIGTTALGLLLVALGTLMIILPGLTLALPMLGLAFHAALGPIGLITLAITALIAIGVLLWKNWDDISARASTVWNNLISYFNQVWGSIRTIFSGIANSMWSPIKTAIDFIVGYVERIIASITRLWNFVTGLFAPTLAPADDDGALRGGRRQLTQREVFEAERPSPRSFITPSDFESLANGGIAMNPMLVSIAEKKPEAVIPLDKLGMLGGVIISGNNFYVREEADINKIGKALVDEIRRKTGIRH